MESNSSAVITLLYVFVPSKTVIPYGMDSLVVPGIKLSISISKSLRLPPIILAPLEYKLPMVIFPPPR